VVKLVNNALVFENTVAIAEMMVLSERAGVPPAVLLDAVAKGSGDSFALRNHARKSMLPREFPEKSFPPEYVLKDIGYVLELAAQVIGCVTGFVVVYLLGLACVNLIQKILGLRVDLADETSGLDWSEVGALGYQGDIEQED